jgi:hypothetical protein
MDENRRSDLSLGHRARLRDVQTVSALFLYYAEISKKPILAMNESANLLTPATH